MTEIPQNVVPDWRPFSGAEFFDQNHLHVFCSSLSADFFQPERLPDDEKQRLGKIHSVAARRRFVLGRIVLRRILGAMLNSLPEKIIFDFGPHGKPRILNPRTDCCFNLSHSGDVLLMALAHGHEIGIDVEKIRPIGNSKEIVRRYFSDTEISSHESLPEVEQLEDFFVTWTQKEAYLKMTGQGMSEGLKTVDLATQNLITFAPCAGYVASLCSAGKSLPINFWSLTPL